MLLHLPRNFIGFGVHGRDLLIGDEVKKSTSVKRKVARANLISPRKNP